ncbi:MAG: DNA polymerase I [Helicobacter sp.]|nr:DNA polymerase I [Helicobacter sp.]
MKTLTIIDTFGFLFRSYFALPPLRNHEGFPTGLLTGFAKLIMQLYKDYPEDYLVFALEGKGENFRKNIDSNYKAQRKEAPDDLKLQLPIAIKWVEQMGFKNISIEGYEADDIIASLNQWANKLQVKVRIISHDKDLYQLISDNTFLYNPSKKQEIREQDCIEKYGIPPRQFIDYQSIVGDSIDNVPGVKGVGGKGAVELLKRFETLEGIYANLDKIEPQRLRNLLEASQKEAFISRELVRLREDIIEDFCLEDCLMPLENPLLKIEEELKKYDLQSILKKLKIAPKLSFETSQNFTFNPILLNTPKSLEQVLSQITPDCVIAFDTETTSLDIHNANLVGFSFSLDGTDSYYVPVGHNYLGVEEQISLTQAKETILKIFSAKAVIGHNIKYDLEILYNVFGFIPEYTKIKDSMILAWLLQSDSLYSLDFLMKKYFKHKMISFDETLKKNENFSQVPINEAYVYACEDASACYHLYFHLQKQLSKELLSLADSLEFPFIQTLVEMEQRGIKVNSLFFKKLKEEMRIKLSKTSEEIFKFAPFRFNINSTQQLAQVLFEELKLPASKKTKVGYSTSESVLQSLYDTHPIIPKILEYRELFKLLSTYVEPLYTYANAHKENRISTSFIQTGTSTGRLSSKNPNLQNIPVKTQEGRRIREGFIAKEDCVLLSLDYSQIELRLLAHFSKDKDMVQAFLDNQDIHLQTAKKLFGEENAEQKRSIAKSINFGLIYGMGAKKLSETLKIPYKESKIYIQNYFASFPTVKEFLKNQEEFILKNSYSQTLFGRKRIFNFEGIQEYQKAAFLREGINAIFQGSAADIIKLAMLTITKAKFQSKLLIQIHDELIFESPKSIANEEAKAIAKIMEEITTLEVPLKCSISLGETWGDLK